MANLQAAALATSSTSETWSGLNRSDKHNRKRKLKQASGGMIVRLLVRRTWQTVPNIPVYVKTAAKMPAKHQVQIRIPKVGRAQSRALPPQCSQKGRRAASCIIASLQRDAEELQSMRLPAPSGVAHDVMHVSPRDHSAGPHAYTYAALLSLAAKTLTSSSHWS